MVNTQYIQLLADIPDADFELKCILEQITGTRFPSHLSPDQHQQILSMIHRRILGEPLQYILGEWEFYGLKIFVGNGVLIPRPDTEILIDTILHQYQNQSALKILDLCTGSGCIAIALKKYLPDAHVSAVDISPDALAYARKNIDYHHLDIQLFHADVLDQHFAQQFQHFDIIVSNPPYLSSQDMQELQIEVTHEPPLALFAHENGTFFYRNITSIWKNTLNPGGLLAFEIGWKQAQQVSQFLISHNFRDIQIIQDYEHRDRVVTAKKFSQL